MNRTWTIVVAIVATVMVIAALTVWTLSLAQPWRPPPPCAGWVSSCPHEGGSATRSPT